jgi:hypothetical protein
MRRFLLRLANAVRPGGAEADLACEIASHLALLEDDFQRNLERISRSLVGDGL